MDATEGRTNNSSRYCAGRRARLVAVPIRDGSSKPRTASSNMIELVFMRLVRIRAWLMLKTFTAGAACVITSPDGLVLLVKPLYRSGWGFAGGHMNPGEQPGGALEREVREEVGIAINVEEPAVVFVQHGGRHIDHVYVKEVDQASVRAAHVASWEIELVAWFSPDRLPPLQPEAQEMIDRLRRIGRLPW